MARRGGGRGFSARQKVKSEPSHASEFSPSPSFSLLFTPGLAPFLLLFSHSRTLPSFPPLPHLQFQRRLVVTRSVAASSSSSSSSRPPCFAPRRRRRRRQRRRRLSASHAQASAQTISPLPSRFFSGFSNSEGGRKGEGDSWGLFYPFLPPLPLPSLGHGGSKGRQEEEEAFLLLCELRKREEEKKVNLRNHQRPKGAREPLDRASACREGGKEEWMPRRRKFPPLFVAKGPPQSPPPPPPHT